VEELRFQLVASRKEVQQLLKENSDTNNQIGQLATEVNLVKWKLDVSRHDIAMNHEELMQIAHRSDRHYSEFTLTKGDTPKSIDGVMLQVKDLNPKKQRFTLSVVIDDKSVDMKDNNIEVPIHFYRGRGDQNLYEIVVWTVDKNGIAGYLATPKGMNSPGLQERRSESPSQMNSPGQPEMPEKRCCVP